jgi:hypothetical protein
MVSPSRRTLLICLLALVPVLAGGAVGALAGGVLPGSDLVATVPTGTDATPSQHPVIDTVAGVAAVGLEEETPFSGVRRPAGGALVSGPPQESGSEIGPQLVGPDGTITAIWTVSKSLHAARLAPGATTWSPITAVANATIAAKGAVIAPDGSITALTYNNDSTPAKLVSRRLPAGAGSWEAPVTVKELETGAKVDGEPELARSAAGVVMAGWQEKTSTTEKVGGALQATNGTWPAAAHDLVGNGERLLLGAIAVAPEGRSGRLVIDDVTTSGTPQIKVLAEQVTDSGGVPMAGVPAPTQGDGSFFGLDATFSADGTLRIIGEREGGLDESDTPTTNNGQIPGAPYTVVEAEEPVNGGRPALATLPDGEMLLSYAPKNNGTHGPPVELLRRPAGQPWSSPQQLVAAGASSIRLGGIAVDPGGDAYVTWSTLIDHTKATLSGAIIDNSAPVIEGLSLPAGVAGSPVVLGVGANDAWSTTTAHWNFGDGTSGEGAAPSHVYAAAGLYPVVVTVTDAAGNATTTSGTVSVGPAPPGPPPPGAKKDTTPPKLAIGQPTCAKKLAAAKCRELRAASKSWHQVQGTVSDAGGVASVTLQATSGTGRKCTVLVAKGKAKGAPCAKAAKLKATVKGGTWTVKTPGIGAGTWKLKATATDRAGNSRTALLTLHLSS